MSKVYGAKGDFGLSNRAVSKTQIVGIYDLVGFTESGSNNELLDAVRTMETQLELNLNPEFWWDERTTGGREKPTNDILLRSTGDGYILAFSQGFDDLKALGFLTQIYKDIGKKHAVRLGINKGDNYVDSDLNERVNIIGWGINFAARALQFAEAKQIICTGYFAEPLLNTHKDDLENVMIPLGNRRIKNTDLDLFNHYKKGEFGAAATETQRRKH